MKRRTCCVVVNYNNPSMTMDCVRALAASSVSLRITVVDNGSTSKNSAVLCKLWQSLYSEKTILKSSEPLEGPLPDNFLLLLPQNVGFSAGNNAALRLLLQHSVCTDFWLLNNDTLPAHDALEKMQERTLTNESIGICGSTLVYGHAPECVQAAGGGTVSPLTGRTDFLQGGKALSGLGPLNVEDIEKKIDFIVGASMLVRRNVLEKIGLLPEEYFLYYEDVAYSLMARKAGFALVWAKESVVIHKEGASTGAIGGGGDRTIDKPFLMDYLAVRNRFYLIRQFYPWALPIAWGSLLGVAAKRILRKQARRIPCMARAAWKGMWRRMERPDDANML